MNEMHSTASANGSNGHYDPVAEVLSRLKGVVETPNGYDAFCPKHEPDGEAGGHKRSLGISRGSDGRCLLNCRGGCTFGQVHIALNMLSSELFPDRKCPPEPKRKGKSSSNGKAPLGDIEATYDYVDEQGALLYQVVRYEGKEFRQRRPDGNGGWAWNVGNVRRVLFRLPAIVQADAETTIYIVEGEKDAMTLIGKGLVSTCNAGGAKKWKRDYGPSLTGRRVVIFPDNDAAGRQHAAQVASYLIGHVTSLKVVHLPDLPEKGDVTDWFRAGGTVEKLAELVAAAPEATQVDSQVDDDDTDVDDKEDKPRQSQADKLVELAHDCGVEFFHTPGGDPEAYASIPVGDHRETMRVWSKAFKMFLARQLWTATAKAPAAQSLQDALGVVAGQALWEGEEHPVAVRLAEHGSDIYLDLADPDWQVVRITAADWQVVKNPPVRFARPRGVLPLPLPEAGGSFDDLRPFVNVGSDDDFMLLVACMVSYLRPSRPFPLLALYGEQGSAKSTTTRIIRESLDPNAAGLRAAPREPRDLMIAASNSWLVALENLSGIPEWLSDALCRLATGGGFGTRELYSDGEEKLFDAMRPIIVNGIVEVVTRADLADRTVAITLPTIPEERRRTESDFWPRYYQARPRILGALLTAVSTALRRLPETKLDRLPRMADFATWATAALGSEFLDAYAGNRASLNETALESCVVAQYIGIVVDRHPEGWTGTAAELLELLDGMAVDDVRRRKDWPSKANTLAGTLRRIAPNLRQVGVDVTFNREPGGKRKRVIYLTPTRSDVQKIVPTVPHRPAPCTETTSGDGGTVPPPSRGSSHRPEDRPVETTENVEKTTVRDDGTIRDDEIPSLSHRAVMASEVQHHDPACTSLRFWESIYDSFHCRDCWPCKDHRAREREGIAI